MKEQNKVKRKGAKSRNKTFVWKKADGIRKKLELSLLPFERFFLSSSSSFPFLVIGGGVGCLACLYVWGREKKFLILTSFKHSHSSLLLQQLLLLLYLFHSLVSFKGTSNICCPFESKFSIDRWIEIRSTSSYFHSGEWNIICSQIKSDNRSDRPGWARSPTVCRYTRPTLSLF